MKIAYVSNYDPHDLKSWSGTIYKIGQALEKQGIEMDYAGPFDVTLNLSFRLRRRLYERIFKRNFLALYDPLFVNSFARQTAFHLEGKEVDVIVSCHTHVLSALEPKRPIVYWGDSCFGGLQNFYPYYSNLCGETIRNGFRVEKIAFERCRLAIYSSDWAAQTAIQFHGLDPRKAAVVPYGANIDCSRTLEDVRRLVAGRSREGCKLLFIGKIWERKGGDLVVKVAKHLHESGLPVELTLVGSGPEDGVPLPPYIKSLGFINKATPEGKRLIDSLFEEAHFLFVPSRAEAYGIVFCEASSFGVPSITTNVGGIPTVVRNGRNGQTFGLDASVEQYCDYICQTMRNRQVYEQLALSAFEEYQTRLNWDTAGRAVKKLIEEII